MRDYDRLDRASNFGIWKAKIFLLLEENDLKEYATSVIVVPTNPQQLSMYKKKDAKARRIILDGIKDHIVPHIAKLDTTKKTWDTVMNLY